VILPALKDATTDRRLRGTPLHVLFYLHGVLDVGEDRHVKAWLIAQEIGAKRANVSRALNLLVQTGYIRTGKNAEANIHSYRLVATREVCDLKQSA